MDAIYKDPLITMADGALTIRRYHFPFATSKHIPLETIRTAREMRIGAMTGRWRLWGTTTPRYWLNFDPARPRKRTGFVLESGRRPSPSSHRTIRTPFAPRSRRAASLSRTATQTMRNLDTTPVDR
jgi:hypothetical protein